MANFSSVAFIVAPSMQCPAVHALACPRGGGCHCRRTEQAAAKASFCQHRLPDQGGHQVCTFAPMHLPANDLAAEDVDDQIELENVPATGLGIQVQISQGALA
jgi:hypothetical protein